MIVLFSFTIAKATNKKFLIFISDFVTAFAIKNKKDLPLPKQVNETFTQQISYARVKVNRQNNPRSQAKWKNLYIILFFYLYFVL